MRRDLFYRLPTPAALLLVATILDLTSAHVLQPFPRQTPPPTTTLPHHKLDVVSWPLLPTPAPLDPLDLRRRQIAATVCGYIGGLSQLPATCSAGSHCVLDSAHGVVGCCPDGEEECQSGVFTGCVDANSGPQTEVNPYVYTCEGGNVCYKNQFEGGFSQFGCGTASDLAATVLATASGITESLDRQTQTSIALTKSATTLSEPTTLGSVRSSQSSSTLDSSSSSTSTSSSASASESDADSSTTVITSKPSTTRTSSSSATASSTDPPPAAPSASDPPNRTGAIVGGTVSAVAAVAIIAGVAYFFYRRRQKNLRQGPGSNSPASGTYISAPRPGPGTGFTAIEQNSDAYERAFLPPVTTAPTFSADLSAGGPSPFAYMGAGAAHDSYPPADPVTNSANYSYPTGPQYPAAYAATGHGHSRLEPDQIPLTREIDDFSNGFQQALGRIGEDDEPAYNGSGYGNGGNGHGGFSDELSANEGNGIHGPPGGDQEGGYHGNVRPLWQQNRRQSRNLMWM